MFSLFEKTCKTGFRNTHNASSYFFPECVCVSDSEIRWSVRGPYKGHSRASSWPLWALTSAVQELHKYAILEGLLPTLRTIPLLGSCERFTGKTWISIGFRRISFFHCFFLSRRWRRWKMGKHLSVSAEICHGGLFLISAAASESRRENHDIMPLGPWNLIQSYNKEHDCIRQNTSRSCQCHSPNPA